MAEHSSRRTRWIAFVADGADAVGRTAGRARRTLLRETAYSYERHEVRLLHWDASERVWVEYRERTDSYLGRGPLWVPCVRPGGAA